MNSPYDNVAARVTRCSVRPEQPARQRRHENREPSVVSCLTASLERRTPGQSGQRPHRPTHFEVAAAKTLTRCYFVGRAQDRLWGDNDDRSKCPRGCYVPSRGIPTSL